MNNTMAIDHRPSSQQCTISESSSSKQCAFSPSIYSLGGTADEQ